MLFSLLTGAGTGFSEVIWNDSGEFNYSNYVKNPKIRHRFILDKEINLLNGQCQSQLLYNSFFLTEASVFQRINS